MIEDQVLSILDDGSLLKKPVIADRISSSEAEVTSALRSLRAQGKVRRVRACYMSTAFRQPDELSVARQIAAYENSGELFSSKDLSEKAGVSQRMAKEAMYLLGIIGFVRTEDGSHFIALMPDLPGFTRSDKALLRLLGSNVTLDWSEAASETGFSERTVQAGLRALTKAGLARKVGRKYKATGAAVIRKALGICAKEYQVKKQEEGQVLLNFLRIPRTMKELVSFTGRTRQGLDRKLKSLVEAGKLHKGEAPQEMNSRVAYCTQKEYLEIWSAPAQTSLTSAAKDFLAVMPSTGFVSSASIAKAVSVSVPVAKRVLKELVDAKMLISVKAPYFNIYSLTKEGRCNPEVEWKTPRMKADDLLPIIGALRADVLRILSVLGEATASEIRHALIGLHRQVRFDTLSVDLEMLADLKFVTQAHDEEAGRDVYRLDLLGILATTAIESRHQAYNQSYVRRAIAVGQGEKMRFWPKNGVESVLRKLSEARVMSAEQLSQCPEVPYVNAREVSVVMGVLQGSGVVQCAESGWRLTDQSSVAAE